MAVKILIFHFLILNIRLFNIRLCFAQNWWNFENVEDPSKYPPFTPIPEIRYTHNTSLGTYGQMQDDVIVNIPKAGFGTFVGFSQWVNYDYTWTSWPPQVGRLVNVFLGIPYAAPPIGNLRFRRPIPAYLDARYIWYSKKFKPACLQLTTHLQNKIENFTDFSEDCLYLNIFYPNRTWESQTIKYPVVVHVHGGSFVYGSSHVYPGHSLASTGVVVVTFNYRLGPMGFLATGDFASIGNYGLWDQLMAMQWVKDNIFWFRGNNARITLMGESAGAASVGIHLVSPVSRDRDLYHQAIMMSGSEMAQWAVADPDNVKARTYVDMLATKLGCFNVDMYQEVYCLRNFPDANRLISMAYSITSPPGAPQQVWSPVVDGTAGFLPRHPRLERIQGRYTRLPFMAGVVHSEASWLIDQILNVVLHKKITEPLYYVDVKSLINHFINTTNVFRINQTAEELELRYTWWSNLANESARTEEIINLYSDYYIKSPLYETLLSQANGTEHNYFYEWAYRGLNDTVPYEMGIYHGVDTMFVFGFPFMNYSFGQQLYGPGLKFRQINKTWNYPFDTNMSEFAMHMWSNFITYGNPTPWEMHNVTWIPFTVSDQNYLHVYINSSNYKEYRMSQLAFWRMKFDWVAEPLPAMDFVHIYPFYEVQIATICLAVAICFIIIAVAFVLYFICRRSDPDKFKTKVRVRGGDKFTSAFQDRFTDYGQTESKSLV